MTTYRVIIERLDGPAGHPVPGSKICETEGDRLSDALRALANRMDGFDEFAHVTIPEGLHVL